LTRIFEDAFEILRDFRWDSLEFIRIFQDFSGFLRMFEDSCKVHKDLDGNLENL